MMQRRGSHSLPTLAIGALLLVEGCTVGPRYRQPVVPAPDAWRMPVSESESLANEKWWELLKDPVLQQLIRTSLANNTDIRTAASQVVEAQAQVMVARSALFPQVSVDPSAERERTANDGDGASTPARTFNAFALPGSVSYAVDFWGLFRRATEEARDELLATEQARRNVILGVVSSVAQ